MGNGYYVVPISRKMHNVHCDCYSQNLPEGLTQFVLQQEYKVTTSFFGHTQTYCSILMLFYKFLLFVFKNVVTLQFYDLII